MSDEHKPHDDHGHDAGHGHAHDAGHGHGHDDHAPAHHDGHSPEAAHGHDTVVAEAPGHHDAHAADGHGRDADHGHAHDAGHGHDAPAAAHHDDHGHGAPAAAHHDDHGHGHDAHDHGHDAPAAAHHDDHGHGHDAHAPAPHDDHGHHDAHAAAPAAVAAAAAASAASAGGKAPVWSDAGDAPFEDVEATPVYARGKKGKKSRDGGGNETWEIIKTIVFALLIALVLRVLLFQPFTIPSASMEPNLYEGDYIVVSKWSYGYSKHSIPFSPPVFEGRLFEQTPERGDIVVFKLPRDDKTDYIKRLIGLPGDRVQMINNVLHINGAPVRDVAVSTQQLTNMFGAPIIQSDETLPGGKTFRIQDFGPGMDLDNTVEFVVPAGHYFMMGDNRDNSIDSRVDQSMGVGLVPAENLIGKAEIILFSWTPGASLWNPVSWFANVRPSRFFTVLD